MMNVTTNRKKKILLVIHMQNDYIDGALKKAGAMDIIDKVNDKITAYRNSDDIVIFTRDTHYDNYLETREGKRLPIPHCIKGTQGWQITSKIEVEGDKVIDTSTLGSLELADYVAALGTDEIESIELVGICTDICVISNAIIMRAKFPEKEILVDSACCVGVKPESHNNSLKAMERCHIKVI